MVVVQPKGEESKKLGGKLARNIGPSCRLCRREGMKLFLKGNKCVTEKCPFIKRNYAPGQHGQTKPKLSNYGLQLREKQKVKRIYGVLERQFRRYFQVAAKSKGITGKILLQLLERRLDNVIFRLCYANSRREARQITNHGHVFVNNKRVNIPSYLVKKDDLIQIKGKENFLKMTRENSKLTSERGAPVWLEVNFDSLSGKVIRLPEKEDTQLPIQEQLIIELYSK
jgi:small subunit ribosomal protein S4